jgi:hypothetical protein
MLLPRRPHSPPESEAWMEALSPLQLNSHRRPFFSRTVNNPGEGVLVGLFLFLGRFINSRYQEGEVAASRFSFCSLKLFQRRKRRGDSAIAVKN